MSEQTTSQTPGRTEYQALILKVDAFCQRAEAAQGPFLVCKPGCDGCCRVSRNAFAVELDAIRVWFEAHPEVRTLVQSRDTDPERCVFLDAEGRCDIYPVRPLICRTHGPAVQSEGELMWCGLNFTGHAPSAVPELFPTDAILNLDLLNQMLALINARFVEAHGGEARAPLAEALTEG